MPITRRTLLASAPLLAALPRVARAATQVNFVPQTDLAGLDPIWSTQTAARNHGYMVFDTLFATDAELRQRPQMAEGLEVSADGLTNTIRLRAGLRFHDGAAVLARDCIASIRRWASRDPIGRLLMKTTREMAAPDDRTIRIVTAAPFPSLAYALGKLSTPVPFMMPERIAAIPATEQIKEAIGSGPFRFVASEWVQGSRIVYEKFAGYVPRDEAPSGTAGGKVVNVDRVVWSVMPDPGTAIAALQTGAADWMEYPPQDLVPLLAGRRDIVVRPIDPLGFITVGRMNHAQPPFDNPKVRRAFATAVDQRAFMEAAVGDAQFWRGCRAFLPCGTRWTADDVIPFMTGDLAQGRKLLAESGYDGAKVVVLSVSDNATLNACATVAADLMQKLGMKAELVTTDVAGLMRRRISREPVDKGGWNFFVTFSGALGASNPADFTWLQADGASGPPGWPEDTALQALLVDFLAAPDDAARARIGTAIGARAADVLPFVPLGQFSQPTAFRANLSDVLTGGATIFWGLKKG